MPPLVNLATAREHIETGLVDGALQRLINDAEQAVTSRYGDHASNGNVVEIHAGNVPLLFPRRQAGAIVSISEQIGSITTALDVTDFRSELNGRQVRRLSGGLNSRGTWGERITVTYTPTSDDARRTRVILDLVRLAVRYEGVKSQTDGDHSEVQVDDYREARENILAELEPAFA